MMKKAQHDQRCDDRASIPGAGASRQRKRHLTPVTAKFMDTFLFLLSIPAGIILMLFICFLIWPPIPRSGQD